MEHREWIKSILAIDKALDQISMTTQKSIKIPRQKASTEGGTISKERYGEYHEFTPRQR